MYNLQVCIDRINELTSKQNLSINKMLKEAGLPTTVMDNIKRGRIPAIDKIHCLADYFNVSVDYLLGRTDNPEVNR